MGRERERERVAHTNTHMQKLTRTKTHSLTYTHIHAYIYIYIYICDGCSMNNKIFLKAEINSFEQSSVIKFLVAEKCKSCEIY